MAHLAHYRQAHPFVFVVTHWINLLAMIVLIVSGIYIRIPFVPGLMGIARGLHIACGFILFINCVFRVVAAFFVKTAPTGGTRLQVRDYKTWLPQKDNRHQAGAWIRYYLFFKKDHPLGAKLGVPQKISYLCIPLLIVTMFYTGCCLWGTTAELPVFATGVRLVGGLMSMRLIHYFLMFVFICFMLIHIYLANVEGIAPSKLMFFHKEHGGLVYDPAHHVIVGKDDLHDEEASEEVDEDTGEDASGNTIEDTGESANEEASEETSKNISENAHEDDR